MVSNPILQVIILVSQHFSSFTRFARFCAAPTFAALHIQNLSKIGTKINEFGEISENISSGNSAKFCQISKIQLLSSRSFCRSKTMLHNERTYLQKSVPIQPKTGQTSAKPRFSAELARRFIYQYYTGILFERHLI